MNTLRRAAGHISLWVTQEELTIEDALIGWYRYSFDRYLPQRLYNAAVIAIVARICKLTERRQSKEAAA